MASEYIIHGPEISLFTRKLECAFEFYGARFRRVDKGPEISAALEARSGTHQVPVLETPENWILADTTPIIGLLDARHPARRLVPRGPLGVLVHVVEEVLDEWVARVMVHYRWHYAENTRFIVSGFLGRDVDDEAARAFPPAKWGPRACRATGTELPAQQEAAEAEYAAMLEALEAQLARTPFALGGRPTAVDAMLIGGLRAHTNHDPIPDLSAYPRTLAWETRDARAWPRAGEAVGELAPFPRSTPFADHMLALARDAYLPFVIGNARALAAGEKAFEIETHGSKASYLARPYPERSRRMVHERIEHQLDEAERAEVAAWLEERGLAEAFMP